MNKHEIPEFLINKPFLRYLLVRNAPPGFRFPHETDDIYIKQALRSKNNEYFSKEIAKLKEKMGRFLVSDASG